MRWPINESAGAIGVVAADYRIGAASHALNVLA